MDSLNKKALEGVIQFQIALGLFIFIPAWTIFYWQGWLYWWVMCIGILSITLYFLKRDPALIQRRLSAGPGAEKQQSQKIIQTFSSIFLVILYVLSGLDHHFNFSMVNPSLSILSDVIVAVGLYIIFKVFNENTYTAGIVNVEAEQKIITTGPYNVVRHPMYSGALLLFLFTPLALGSLWSLIPGVLLSGMLIIRLLDEEKFLEVNLDGYKEYQKKVRSRIIPFIY